MKKPKIGFIGYGVVGSATRQLLSDVGHKDVVIYDPPRGLKGPAHDVSECRYIFISVPVPTKSDGKQDLSILKASLDLCAPLSHVFIRSTVLPGTTADLASSRPHLNIYALPEFLTERTAEADVRKLPIICSVAGSNPIRELLPAKALLTLPDENCCEFAKYIHNSFCAVKVGFFNTMYKLAEEMGLDYNRSVAAACDVTGFIEKTHTKVPGPDHQLGFGGKCLPKDLFALATLVQEVTGGDTFLKAVLDENFYNRFPRLF